MSNEYCKYEKKCAMKNKILLLSALLFFAVSGFAQVYDDLYYDPSRASKTVSTQESVYAQQGYDEEYAADDDYYYNEEDYDYYYTSRIRRFHRPLYGFNFFDPFYVDMSYYDPFFTPGMTVLIYDDPYAYRSFYRRNVWRNSLRFNTWAGINPYNSFGWNSWNTWADPWYSPSYYRSGFSFSFGFGRSAWFNRSMWNPYGFSSPFYFTPSWGYGYNYNTFNNVTYNVYNNDVRQREVYYGPRSNAATNVPRSNSPRLRSDTPGDQTDRALGRKSYSNSRGLNPDRPMDRAGVIRNSPDVNSPNVSGRNNPRATGRSSEIDTRRSPSAVNPSDSRTFRGSNFDRSRNTRSNTPSRVNPGAGQQQRTPNVYRPSTRTPNRSSGFNNGSPSRTQPQRSNFGTPRMSAPRSSSPASRPSISAPSRPNVSSGSATRSSSSGGSRKKNE